MIKTTEDSKGQITNGLLIVDFKMKFESKSNRESTVEHFGKRGIGWHGCALVFFLYEKKFDGEGCTVSDTDGQAELEAKKYFVYIDQIMVEVGRVRSTTEPFALHDKAVENSSSSASIE